MFCTEPEPVKSPTQFPSGDKLNIKVNESNKVPDNDLQVKDPYDELLSMILKGYIDTGDTDFCRLSPVDTPSFMLNGESRSSFNLKTENSYQPSVKPTETSPARDSSGSVHLEVHSCKPVTVEPLSITWGGQSKPMTEQPVKSQRPPLVKRSGYIELFIEEEEECRGDKEKDVRGFNERVSPQVEHGVSCIFSICKHYRVLEERIHLTS